MLETELMIVLSAPHPLSVFSIAAHGPTMHPALQARNLTARSTPSSFINLRTLSHKHLFSLLISLSLTNIIVQVFA